MKKSTVLSFIGILFSSLTQAQGIAINEDGSSAHPNAVLDVKSTNKGMLIPRMTQAERLAIFPTATPTAKGMLVYQTDTPQEGFWYYDGSTWIYLNPGSGSAGWLLLGNGGTSETNNFVGTTDDTGLNFRVNNQRAGRLGRENDKNTFLGLRSGNPSTVFDQQNTFIGFEAGTSCNLGQFNTAVGANALRNTTISSHNVAVGASALLNNTSGGFNTAVGFEALRNNTTSNNTAVGYEALRNNTGGDNNTGIGASALRENTIGGNNTAVGVDALYKNNGSGNTAVGKDALRETTSGFWNAAVGVSALRANTTGAGNVAMGYDALRNATMGNDNVAVGSTAMFNNTTGGDNTAVGANALRDNTTAGKNTAVGKNALRNVTSGENNTAIGFEAGYHSNGAITLNNCTFVGAGSFTNTNRTNVTMLGSGIAPAQNTSDNQVLLGNTAVTQIRAQVSSITAYSDSRFKHNISQDVKGLDFIMRLRPVSYNTNPEILHQIWGTPEDFLKNIDHSQIKQTRFVGLLAQEVEQAMKESGYTDFPGIDIPRNEKEVYALRYVDFIMPLIKAVQEQQQIIENQQQTIQALEARAAQLEAIAEELSRLKAQVQLLQAQTAPITAAATKE